MQIPLEHDGSNENESDESLASSELDSSQVRVAFFSDSMPERNGAGAYYHDLAGQLRPHIEALEMFQPLPRKGHDWLSLPMPGDPSQRLVTPNIFRIRKGYKALKPNVVVAITPGPFGLLGLYLAKRSGAQFITAFHTDFEHLAQIYWKPFSRMFANGVLRTINKILCKRSSTVLINNSKLKADVDSLGAPNTEIMGTPLEPAFLETPMIAAPPVVERICFAGRLAPEKNVHLIIEAAANFPNIEFVIGGEGPLRNKLEASAVNLKNVRFTGWLKREELITLLDSSSCLLLPSILETFGTVAFEAMARGRPALVSANAGIHDWSMLEEGLIVLKKEESLTQSIKGLLKLPADSLLKKAFTARKAAEQLNRDTILQWSQVLAKYST
ncbi:MAG: glycosyltransferase [Verrucomicrobia bacterium]|nr:glycosyltransferase [Verrucomicrobiota bacterium]